ncbi:hypothetical protein B0H19DRAFT_1318925 [Mycena capillaripes]|nr:hypothetical protein B0H19DRAFT_1318925 [Mycena capillaripes]
MVPPFGRPNGLLNDRMRPSKQQRRVPPESSVNESSPSQPSRLRILWLAVPAVVAGLAFYFVSGSAEIKINEPRTLEPYVVADLPGKVCVLPTRYAPKLTTVIVSESPAALISRLLHNVSPAGRDAFWNLSYVHFPEGLDPEIHRDEVALAIFQTNAVAAGDSRVGIFPRMARLNHGCSSAFNVVYSWREKEQKLFVHALRNIHKGQELLTTYTDTKRTRKERREFLSQQYGFRCTCAVCSLDAAASAASDKRLSAISHYYGQVATWGTNTINGVEAISIINKIWKLEDEEGYWSERGRLAADGAWIASSHSDASAARLWAQLAIKWYTYELGADSELVTDVERTARNPEEHPAWGSRERLTVGLPEGTSR